MFRKTLRPSGIAALVLAAVVLATSPALADGKGRGHGHGHDRHRHHRDHAVQVVPSPRHVHHHYAHAYPVWFRAPGRIVYHDASPFFFHSGFGVFFGGSAFDFHVADLPPYGYVYADPYCDRTFVSVHAYRAHLHRHHHPALIQVVAVSDGAGCSPYTWYRDW